MDCLGFQKGFFVPHSDEPGRRESVKDLLVGKDTVAFLLSNCAALEIIDDKYRIITSNSDSRDITPFALKAYWQDGEYIEEELDISLNFKSLDHLLSKNTIKKIK